MYIVLIISERSKIQIQDSLIGPPKDGRISPDQVKAELKTAGFALIEEPNFLLNQYFLIFQ
jgi:hypothetical protein